MKKTDVKILWVGGGAALVMAFLAWVGFELYWPVYRTRLIRNAQVEASRDGLGRAISDSGPAEYALLREYRNAGYRRAVSILSVPAPKLDPPVLLYATIAMQKGGGKGGIDLKWLEYDFSVTGIALEFADGSIERLPVFPAWTPEDHNWFRAQVHRDADIQVREGV